MGRLIDINYQMAKGGIAFRQFPNFVAVEKKHGVNLGETYHNKIGAKEFTSCIAESLSVDLVSSLDKSNYFTLLMDGSTDSAISENELIYVLYIDSDSGKLVCRYLKNKAIKNANAEGLKTLLKKSLEEMGLNDYEHRLVGLGVDGAAVNFGRKRGLVQLLKSDIPSLNIGVHCFSHRLELAVKDALSTTFLGGDLVTLQTSLFYFYSKSSKRLRDLKKLGEILEEGVKRPHKAHGTRWVQHKLLATEAILDSYTVLTAHLESMATHATQDKAKAKGLLSKLTDFKYLSHLLLFRQLLIPLTRLSQSWQRDATEIPHFLCALKNMKSSFETLKTNSSLADGSGPLAKLMQQAEAAAVDPSVVVKFKEVPLNNIRPGSKYIERHYVNYIVSIESCCEDRFRLSDDKVFNLCKVLDTTLWPLPDRQQAPEVMVVEEPQPHKSLATYGNDEIVKAAEHFQHILGDIDQTETLCQFGEMKDFIVNKMQTVPVDKIWERMSAYSSIYPKILQIINILRVFPFSNAITEKGFSTMRKVKDDWRCSLGIETLDLLIRIKKDGVPFELFNSDGAIDVFFDRKPRHPHVQPYGSHDNEHDIESKKRKIR